MTTYLVTGGAGFIGSHIVRRLVEHGEKVRVLDNFLTGSRDNLKDVADSIDLIEDDIRDFKALQYAMKGVHFCLHQAAIPSVPRSVEDPLTNNEINVTGTLNTLLAARDAGVERFVFASSSSVYGNSPVLPKHEDMPPQAISPYAVSKLAGEYYARMFSQLYGLPTVCLRYFNVFGARQNPDSAYAAAIPLFISAMLNDKPPTVHGDGEQSRDFCYIDNVISANLLACTASSDKVAGNVFNVACGDRITINDLVSALNDILGTRIESVHVEPRKGDVRHSIADISRARDLLGYTPRVTFREGLSQTVDWFKKERAGSTA